MLHQTRAPNRLLDLGELDSPHFRSILDRMTSSSPVIRSPLWTGFPYGIGEEVAYDHPEEITLFSEVGTAPVQLLVYDSPHHGRIDGADGVDADFFVIPGYRPAHSAPPCCVRR